MPKTLRLSLVVAATIGLTAHAANEGLPADQLPSGAAEKVVSVTRSGAPPASLTVITEAIAIRETGPKETVEHFGEIYTFSPPLFVVHRDEATRITFRNLQPDDLHDFMLVDRSRNALMHIMLPPLRETSYTFSFHKEGLFNFYCTMHQPVMSGQILVLPPEPN
jgi:plastocyanin